MANNRSDHNLRDRPTSQQTTTGAPAGRGLRLFAQRTPDALRSAAPGPYGGFFDTWISRLLIGGALLLLIIMFPLQWLRTPSLVVRANVSTFAPRPGVDTAAGGATGAVTANYDLSEEASITAQVYDAAGALVKTLQTNYRQSAGPHFIAWDGTTDSGAVAPDGAYHLDITAKG